MIGRVLQKKQKFQLFQNINYRGITDDFFFCIVFWIDFKAFNFYNKNRRARKKERGRKAGQGGEVKSGLEVKVQGSV